MVGYVVPPPPEGLATWDDLDRALPPRPQGAAFARSDPSGVSPRLFLPRAPDGEVVKNRLHLDVWFDTHGHSWGGPLYARPADPTDARG